MPASVASSDGRGPASSTSSLTGASANPATSGLAAALKGATLAFQHQQKTAAKGNEHTAVPRTLGSSRVLTPGTPVSAATSRTVGGSNGAFLAANVAAREHSPPTATPTYKNEASRVATPASSSSHSSAGSTSMTNRQEQAHGQVTGGSSQQTQHVEARTGNDHAPSKRPKMHSRRPSLALVSTQAVSNTNSHPPTPTTTSKSGPEPKAASWIAATLAASRSGTPSPSPSLSSMNQQTHPALAQQHVRSGRTRSSSVATSTVDTNSPPALESHHLDTASIPPTSSLVAIYDGKQEEAEPVKKAKKKKKKSPPASRAEYHPKITSSSPTPSKSPSMEKRPGTSREPAVAPGKMKPAPKPKPKPRRDISLSTVESIGSTTGTMGWEGELNSQGQGETRNRDGDARGKASRDGEDQATETRAKDIAAVETSGRKNQQKSPPATPRTVQSKQGVEVEVPTDNKRPSTPPVPQHAHISETKIVSPQPRRVILTPRLESSPALPTNPSKPVVTSPKPDNNNKPTIRKSSRVVSSSMDQQSQTTRQSAAETVSLGDRRLSQNSTSSDETFVSASSSPSPRPRSPVATKIELERERARPQLDRTNTGTTSSRASRVSTPASVRSPVSQTRPSPVLRPGTGLHSYSTGASPTPEMSLDSLTNAMIASNLASSRLAALTQSSSLDSPGLPPLPPPRRSHRHHHHPHLRHHAQSPPYASPLIPQRTADSLPLRRQMEKSQPTSLLKTLRAPRSLSDDEDLRLQTARHRKKHLGVVPSSKKKHAHNEGARRRWRDEMTLRQRRRYEAVWASNRGLFLRTDFAFEHPDNWQPPTPPPGDSPVRQVDLARAWDGPEADLVVNIVVRDIWSRSRLPVDELAEVWELVDRRKCGALDKQEFVVGMWLIDQRLRGRKIPTVVGEGVWESARDRVMSVNVKAPKGKHHHHGHRGHGHGYKSGGRTRGHLKGAF